MPSFFDQLTNDIKLKCPLLTNVANSLAVGKSTEKNVGKKDCDFKLKAAIQTVMALDDIRSERFSTVFGLLLIAHGAGKAMLNVLDPFRGGSRPYQPYQVIRSNFANRVLE